MGKEMLPVGPGCGSGIQGSELPHAIGVVIDS